MSKIFILNRKDGITLVETIFSVLIIALVLVSVLIVFTQTIEISKRIDYEYAATNLAKSRIERAQRAMAAGGFDSLPDLNETDTTLDWDGSPETDGIFRRSTTITTNYHNSSQLTQIEVSVKYKYLGNWKEDAAVNMTTVFTDVDL